MTHLTPYPSLVTLRPYQENFLADIRSALAIDAQVLACSATGSGKTKVFLEISRRAIQTGKTVLIITESDKIFKQISQESQSVHIKSGVKEFFIRKNYIYLAMAQTLIKRKGMIENFNYLGKELIVIIDEAHVGTATKILQALKDPYFIGFTATPDFRFAKHLPELYKCLVIGPQPHELVNSGHLAQYKHFARVSAKLDELKISRGEYTEQSQERVFQSKPVYDGLIEDLKKLPYKKCVIFTASIKHCRAVYLTLTEAGFRCVTVHSKLPKGNKNLEKFTGGDIDICISVGTLTKGFDEPKIDMVVLYRKTKSLPLYLQMIGRGSRISPGKEYFTVLDYGGNYQEHQQWDYERDWTTMWNAKPKFNRDGVAPIKACPKCDYIVPAIVMICPNCGHHFIKPDATKEETQLIEVTKAYSELVGKGILDLTAKELAVYARMKNQKHFSMMVARKKGREFLRAFGAEMGYKLGWAEHQMKMPDKPVNNFSLK